MQTVKLIFNCSLLLKKMENLEKLNIDTNFIMAFNWIASRCSRLLFSMLSNYNMYQIVLRINHICIFHQRWAPRYYIKSRLPSRLTVNRITLGFICIGRCKWVVCLQFFCICMYCFWKWNKNYEILSAENVLKWFKHTTMFVQSILRGELRTADEANECDINVYIAMIFQMCCSSEEFRTIGAFESWLFMSSPVEFKSIRWNERFAAIFT